MTRSIFKYSLTDGVVYMPKDAEILKVGMQDGIPCLWAMVDPHGEREMRYFTALGTGMLIPDDWRYVGTLFDRQYVWHVFETKERVTEDEQA